LRRITTFRASRRVTTRKSPSIARCRRFCKLATGTGKTVIAFQICYKLWSSRWNHAGEHRPPGILYLADRNVLLDVPKDQTFAPFGDARWTIQGDGSAPTAGLVMDMEGNLYGTTSWGGSHGYGTVFKLVP